MRHIFLLLFICLSFLTVNAQDFGTVKKDSIPNTKEINLTETDTIKKDSIVQKTFLEGNVVYSASDYMRLNRRNNKMYLHNNAKIKYSDMDIEAGKVIVNQLKKEVYASGIKDTAKVYTQTPIFTQGENIVEPDTIRFNFSTKKALIYNSKTNQDGFNILNEISKRENDSVVYMKNVRFTTSTNIEDPEYYFYARRIKFVPGKKIITGLVNMYIADVPTPLGLPFGYFPLKQEAVSGFIIPSFNDSNDRGFTFQNGGYYFAISDYINLTLVGDYSTNNSYALRTESNYSKRYKFNGGINLRFENNIFSERGLPDFSKTSNYNIQWQHNQDTKASPNSRFSANVNFGSTRFFRESLNQSNVGSTLNNNLSSNIGYSRTFPVKPRIDFQTALSIQQNSRSETDNVNISTPTSINVDRIYPFTPKSGIRKGILQNITFQPSSTLSNSVTTSEGDIFTSQTLKDAEIGVQHRIPISTNFKLFNYLSANAGTSYTESWVFESINRRFDPTLNNNNGEVVTETNKGFQSFRSYNFSGGLGTTAYGTIQFNKNAKIKAIRHVIRPQVSYSYTPTLNQELEEYIIPANPATNTPSEIVTYSKFEGGVFQPSRSSESSSLRFSISNTLEAKVVDRDTTKLEPKIIKIFNSLNLSSQYNFKADSLKLSPISVSGSIPIIKKLTINFNGTLDPYALNSANERIDTWNIDNGGSLFRLTNASTNFGYSFSSKEIANKIEKNRDSETSRNGGRDDNLFGTGTNFRNGKLFEDETAEEKKSKTNIDFYNYKIPWSLNLTYNINYNNRGRRDLISSHSINFSGDVELAPRWKIGASSGYDIANKDFTFTNLRFQRDLESWTMSFNWVPFSDNATWNFFIGISSSVLSDIKWDKRRQPDRRL